MIWSCLPVSLFPRIISGEMRVGEWVAAARDMGFDAIDLSILFIAQRTPAALARVGAEIRAGGLPVAMITTYPDFTQPDPAARERELAHCLSDLAVAAELGARYLRVTAGQTHPNLVDADGVRYAADCFAVCLERAGRWGVELLLENHSKPGAWDRPDFDFHTGRFLALVEATKDMPLGINFDTANTYALGDDAPAVFERVFDRVRSIHINDIADTARLEFVGIGDGGAPIAEIMKIARRRGFDGLLSIEEVGRDGLAGIARSFERSKALWAAAE